LLGYLTERKDEEGRVPTLRQTAADLGVSHTAVAQLMNQLEKKNVLEREWHYGRTIRLYHEQKEKENEN
jgi:repressor LexA